MGNLFISSLSSSFLSNKFLFITAIDKQGVLQVEDFYKLLREEGPINLSDAQKQRIKKLFINLKDNTLPYSTVLKSLEFDG